MNGNLIVKLSGVKEMMMRMKMMSMIGITMWNKMKRTMMKPSLIS
jgi:hypothetical protein